MLIEALNHRLSEVAKRRDAATAAAGTEADPQRDALVALMDRMVNGPAWKKTLETRGWEGIYLTGDKFGEYVKQNVADTTTILKDLGLAS
jgi:putative tricarboxylic transport membrane protein